MLIIRPEQIAALRSAAVQRFEDEMLAHLCDYSPKYSEVLADHGLRYIIRLGIRRASCYGFTERGAVRLYIELMLLLGIDFDHDPLLPWVAEFLADDKILDQLVRADLLFEKVNHYRNALGGPNLEYYKRSLQSARVIKFENFLCQENEIENSILCLLASIYPEKFYYAGSSAVRNLIQQAHALSFSYGFRKAPCVSVFTAMTFAFGIGSATDLRFPWIAQILNEHPNTEETDHRAEALHIRMIAYFDELLADLSAV